MTTSSPSLCLALGLALLTVAATTGCQAAAVLHVSPQGTPAGQGTHDAPFATLEQARDAIRAMKKSGALPAGGAIVEMHAGVYERATPFELTAEDAGTAQSSIVYRAKPGDEVRLCGGRAVKGLTPVTDPAVLSRLDPAARGQVLQADLKAQGITDFGQLSERGFGKPVKPAHMELFYADKPMTLARWPNQGYARIAELPQGPKSRTFAFSDDRPLRWTGEKDVWVYGYWYHDWADTYLKVESIDADKKTLTTSTQHGYGLRKGNRWCALNVLAELDSPGEYYVDRDKGVLYFWPPKERGSVPEDRDRPRAAVVSVVESLVTMTEVSHVTLRGMILEACRGTAVKVAGGTNCQIVACTIRNTGNAAASIAGAEHAVIGCDIYETGDGGVTLSGGDRKTLTPGKLLAENNHIHHFSRWCHTYRPAIGVAGCGNIVRHNLLHHGPHNAVQLGGNDHVIEFNEIHSVCSDTGDVGAFYTGRDWSARGTVIRHNYFHHVFGPGMLGAMGVYLDDQASGFALTGNVFHKVTRAAFIGGGCDNLVENNLFVDCAPAVHIDARGLGWQKPATDDPKGELRRYLAAMPYQNDLWSRRYPELPNILNDDPGTPKRNKVTRNICVGGKWLDLEGKARPHQVIENNLLDQDPLFVDAAKRDWRLKPESPAWKIGFKAIPFEKIGLYRDDRRASWPVEHAPTEVPTAVAAASPEAAAASAGPAPVCVARRIAKAPTIDGMVDPAEWQAATGVGSDQALTLKEDFNGRTALRQSKAWVVHDGTHLYVAFDNTVLADPKVKVGHDWGQHDAVEIALKNTGAGKDAPVLVLRGYLDGTFESSDEADAPAAAAAKAKEGVEFKAKLVEPTRWSAEWKIPLASLGIDPAKHKQAALNLSVRKTAEDLWLQWRSTRAQTWAVERSGVLKLDD